ncbi:MULTISPECIES: flagellar protein FlhE [Halomonadaceae]|uniref:flagellar protein FlhE n=1 Tax=Halomonadaceae TaxID=28256 RepID=UPI001597F7A7|nr:MULTISPECIES: flagellar protein FlhE [Halomonas]QJQ94406.1 flagellar FlhE [Halomonas sp. PA5]
MAPLGVMASGSWVVSAPSVRVAMAERETHSAPMQFSDGSAVSRGARIHSVSWQYRLPPGTQVRAWLCQENDCITLNQARGSSLALAGRSATRPMHFRFALPQGQKKMVEVRELQLIVNYH